MKEEEKKFNCEYDTVCKCPYCGDRYDDIGELLQNEDDCEELECGNCGKKFEATLNISYHYDTKTMELIEKEKEQREQWKKEYEAKEKEKENDKNV